MEFRTQVSIPRPLFSFSYQDVIMLMGSCFAGNMGVKFEANKFTAHINPFGTLYNPSSISQSIRRLMNPLKFTSSDLIHHEGVYHSFAHHSHFSSMYKDEALDMINRRMLASSEALGSVTRLVITFGTSYVYRLKSNGEVVANCHKMSEKIFTREMLTVEEIVNDWNVLLLSLWEQNPHIKVLFTVSPIRHRKDGAHQNQLSKATLLLAADALQKKYPDHIAYFPAYEIMMDELRDYRFYADDMIHPSVQAIEYIWETFSDNFFSADAKVILKEWQDIKKAINHKPFQPETDAYKQFISQTLLKAEHLNGKFPYFDLANEIEVLRERLK